MDDGNAAASAGFAGPARNRSIVMAQSTRNSAAPRSSAARSGKKAASARTMAEAVSDAAESVQDSGQHLLDRVGRTARNAGEAVMDRASEARHAMAETGERLNDRLRQAASSAEELAQEIPARVGAAASRLQAGPLGEIASDLRHMAKRHPGVFMAGAALAGFALARLLTPRGDRND